MNNKYTILALLFAGWLLGNLDRFMMNYAVIDIAKEFSLTSTEKGLVISSFFIGYTIMKTPGGLLVDKLGFRQIIILSVIMWSIFTSATALAYSLSAMVLVRFLFGVGEGGFFPAASQAITLTFPQQQRSKAVSVVLSATTLMAIVTPLIVTELMTTIGWRQMFHYFGFIGIILTIIYFLLLKVKNPIQDSDTHTSTLSLKDLIKNPIMWNVFFASFSTYVVYWGLFSWIPSYLIAERGLDLKSAGWISSIPSIFGFIAMIISGIIIDRLKIGMDKTISIISSLILGAMVYLMFNADSLQMFTFYNCIAMIVITFVIAVISSIGVKRLPSSIVGVSMGFVNTGGQLAGIVSPILIGWLLDTTGSYYVAFFSLIIFTLISATTFFFIHYNEEGQIEFR